MVKKALKICVIAAGIHLRLSSTFGQCETNPATRISPPPEMQGWGFGNAFAIDGEYLAVRGRSAEDSSLWRVHVFHFDGVNWIDEAELNPSAGLTNGNFGSAVAISGDRVLIGQSGNDEAASDAGCAYVFHRTGTQWTQEAKIFSSTPQASGRFGAAVALNVDLALISEPGTNILHPYRRNEDSWTEESPFSCPGGKCFEAFGFVLAIHDDRALATTLDYSFNAEGQVASPIGAGFVYRRENNSWVYEATIGPPTLVCFYGLTGALSVDRLVMHGFDEIAGTHKSYIYKRTGASWSLEASIPDPNSFLGCSAAQSGLVAIENDAFLLGNPYENGSTGAAYLFHYDGMAWSQTARIANPAGVTQDYFARPVALSGGRAVISAVPSNSPNPRPGAIYIFEAGDCNSNGIADVCDVEECTGDPACSDCNRNGRPDGCDIASGAWADVDANGVPDVCGCDPSPPASPLAEATPYPKNRFISFEPHNPPGRLAAVRIKLNSLHHPDPPYTAGAVSDFSSFEGQFRWLGPVQQFVESTSTQTPFSVSRLQCTPYYTDWSALGLVHVYGYEIVPSSNYDVQMIDFACDGLSEANYSVPITLSTARWGDVVAPFNPPATSTQPDLTDVAELVNKFKSLPGAPIKARALLAGVLPKLDLNVSFEEISACVDAFKGRSYPYPGPLACP